jgi:hypothetical protein
MANKYISPLISVDQSYREFPFYRADIIFHGVDHSGVSYEGRVFLNNPDASEKTPTTVENGYADSYYIFGHGGCFGDEGHCELKTGVRDYDLRALHPVTPFNIRVTVTDALKRTLQHTNNLTVTVVPIIHTPNDALDMDNCLKFKDFYLEFYDLPDAN